MSDEVIDSQPEELVGEPPADLAPIVEAPADEAPAEPGSVQAVEPPTPQPEPFKMRAGVNCVVDGGQVKPL